MADADVQDLVKMVFLNDDQEAFKKLYFYYYERLYKLAKFYTKSAEGAEEIVDDTFLTIWERREHLAGINNFASYLYKVTKNKSLNFIAKGNLPVFTDIDELTTEIADVSLNIEDQLILADLSKLINNAIEKLPDQCRLVFNMVRDDGMPHKEVAELLNISVRTVEYHMGIALKKLAESLNQYSKAINRQAK